MMVMMTMKQRPNSPTTATDVGHHPPPNLRPDNVPDHVPDTLSIDDLANLPEPKLKDLALRFRLPDGTFHLPFVELQDWTLAHHQKFGSAHHFLQSVSKWFDRVVRGTDPEAVAERLEEIVSGRESSTPAVCDDQRSFTFSTTEDDDDDSDSDMDSTDTVTAEIGDEKNDRRELLRLGGRPMYGADVIEPLARGENGYRAALERPFRHGFTETPEGSRLDRELVFSTQVRQWDFFLAHQRQRRNLPTDGELDFDVWASEHDHQMSRMMTRRQYAKWKARMDAKPYRLRDAWVKDRKQEQDDRQRVLTRARQDESKGEGRRGDEDDDATAARMFRNYVEQVKSALETHGITETPAVAAAAAALDENHKRQDRLTTWLEYLAYEYRELDRLTAVALKAVQDREAAWARILASEDWQPAQKTREYIDAYDARLLLAKAEKARAAYNAVFKQLMPLEAEVEGEGETTTGELRRLREVAKAARAHDDAESKQWKEIARYRAAKTGVGYAERERDNYTLYVRWVEAQVPLIQAELVEEARAATEEAAAAPGNGQDQEEGREKKRWKRVKKIRKIWPVPPEGPRRSARIAALPRVQYAPSSRRRKQQHKP